MSVHPEVEKILHGDARTIARAISLIEDQQDAASSLLKALYPHTGRAWVVGVTGAPGAGKSTLVDKLALHYRSQKKSVGIIAVDPSSPFTGGAILGDRIRMQDLATDEGIFIRSMATRGFLGGLARATGDAVSVLDAAKKAVVLIETVGVGQDEVDVVKIAEVVIVMLVPGMGDDIQTIKAGIMEIADIFVINKCDREGADRIQAQLEATLSLSMRPDGWVPPIVRTVATQNEGIDPLAASIERYREFVRASPEQAHKQRLHAQQRLIELLREKLLDRALREDLNEEKLRAYTEALLQRTRDPYSIVEEIIGNSNPR